MHEGDIAIIKALVPVAWSDGNYSSHEKETHEGLLAAYDATDEEKASILSFASQKRTLDDIDLQELSAENRRVLLQHAVLLTYADGDQKPEDAAFLTLMAQRLRIPPDEAAAVMAASAERAK